MKKNILVLINKKIKSGPNSVAKGLLCNEPDSNNSKYSCDLHVLKNKNEVMFNSFIRLLKAAYTGSYKIIHSHSFFPNLVGGLVCLCLLKVKHVATIHNIPQEDYLIRYGKLKGSILLFVHYSILLLLVNKVVCISKAVQNSLPIFLKYKSVVIYNFVDEDFFVANEPLDSEHLYYCGHFSKLKDPTFIINQLKASNYHFQFQLFGTGELKSECELLVKGDSRFHFEGHREDIFKLYHSGGLFIHSSNTEGFCLSVAEALASNMKVLVPNIKIFEEFKNELGLKNIYLYKLGDKDSFNSAFEYAFKAELTTLDNIEHLKVNRFKKDHFRLYDELN